MIISCFKVKAQSTYCVSLFVCLQVEKEIIWNDCEFIFIRINVLREYLEIELKIDNAGIEQDLEVSLLPIGKHYKL